MRVTNSMISNRSQVHISNAKNKMLTAEEQYTTMKKIQRPSEDPTIASRSLKFRTTMAQLTQYVEKNVQDAMDWMDTTEGAMKKVSSTFTDMEGYFSQGANSYPESKERTAILTQLRQYATAIFETIRNVESDIKYQDGMTQEEYAKLEAKVNTGYRIQLSYNNCSNQPITGGNNVFSMSLTYGNTTEEYSVDNGKVGVVSQNDAYAYDIDRYNQVNGTNYEALYIYDAGEIVLGKTLYSTIQEKEANFSIDYTKNKFEKSDIRPEMYFKCDRYDTVSMKNTYFADPSDQNINYEVNFSQTLTVNTQAKDAFDTEIYRCLDYIERVIGDVTDVENRIADVEKKIANTSDQDEIASLGTLKTSLENEQQLRVSIMNEAFGRGLTMVNKCEATLNVAVAELGAKYNRLQMTQDRLSDEKTDTEEKLSNNEDMDIADAVIGLTQADNLYQASLSATAKILGNSLLDYI